MILKILTRYFVRVTKTDSAVKVKNFNQRLKAAPNALLIIATPIALILGRSSIIDLMLFKRVLKPFRAQQPGQP